MSKELEDRFEHFAIMVREFCQKLKWDLINSEYIKQLIRASSSIAANYLEASDDLGRADERMKIKIARRESKESLYYLRLVLVLCILCLPCTLYLNIKPLPSSPIPL